MAHQRPREREHLLLAAGERAGVLAEARRDPGATQGRGDVVVDRAAVDVGAELQVLLDRHLREGAAPFRHVRDAEPRDRLRPAAPERLPLEEDLAAALDRAEIERSVVVLPAPLAPRARRRSAPARRRARPPRARGRGRSAPRRRAARAAPSAASSVPRYASITAGFARTSAGVLGDLLAEVHHVHVVGDPHHEVHVVLDEQHRQLAVVADPWMKWPSSETSSWLSPPAGSSSRSSLGAATRARASSTRFSVPKGRPATGRSAIVPARRTRARRAPPPPCAAANVGADEDVVEHGHRLEQLDVLEGPGDPAPDDPVHRRLQQRSPKRTSPSFGV